MEPPERMRPGDWTCPSCNSHVFASKRECYLCQTSKPTDDETVLVRGEAAPLSKPVEQMKMAELRRALDARGLKSAGLRAALVARLQEAVLVSGEGGQRPEASVTPPPAALPPAALPWICQHCGIGHPSRNALFRHLTQSCDPTAAAGPPTERVGLALAYLGTGFHGANRNAEEDETLRPTVAGAVLDAARRAWGGDGMVTDIVPDPNPNPSPNPNPHP